MNGFRCRAAGALVATLLATVAIAQDAGISGEVKKIDMGAGNITLQHGPAPSLGINEGMTMVYEVRDRTMLKQVKVGDKVMFQAEIGDGGFTVTNLQKSK